MHELSVGTSKLGLASSGVLQLSCHTSAGNKWRPLA
jgi:hypothetical protein